MPLAVVYRRQVGRDLAAAHGEVRRAMLSDFPYAVFYRIEARRVVVLAVLHTARDPKLWPRPRRGSE